MDMTFCNEKLFHYQIQILYQTLHPANNNKNEFCDKSLSQKLKKLSIENILYKHEKFSY